MINGKQTRKRDHPRACGEQSSKLSLMWKMPGSSPRVRGAAAYQLPVIRLPGIIPARAGSSQFIIGILHKVRDHPRACGEQ